MALNAYIQQTQRLLNNPTSTLYSVSDLTNYINLARGQIAGEGQCVRVLPPISSPIMAITVNSSGAGYPSNTSITISAPDSPAGYGSYPNGQQATASVTVAGGAITGASIIVPGSGYYQPQVFISGNGTGANITVTTNVVQTQTGQEVYPFSAVNPLIATSGSGISSILAVNSVNFLWATFRYTLMVYSFSKYQALVRNYTAGGYQFIPAVVAQYGQGVNGSLYMYPVPNTAYQVEWDCYCLPINLATDSDPEAIPYPWTDVVPFHAAYLAYLGAQRQSDASFYWNERNKYMQRARAMSNPRRVINWYGRS